jgi:hypothetical protein
VSENSKSVRKDSKDYVFTILFSISFVVVELRFLSLQKTPKENHFL